MSWVTIYILGNPGFYKEVLKQLHASSLPFMQGSVEGERVAMFWIPQGSTLRNFKMAIGSKIIFKYRLQFYNSYNDLLGVRENKHAKESDFNTQERALIRKIVDRVADQRKSA
jgi:hypothetical protein